MYKHSLNDSFCAAGNDGGFPNKCQQQHHQQSNMCSGSVSLKTMKTPKPSIVRILGRDYPLTATAYKLLTIGIRIGMDLCHVEIAIADNKGSELSFSMSTWKLLLQNEVDIRAVRVLEYSAMNSNTPISEIWTKLRPIKGIRTQQIIPALVKDDKCFRTNQLEIAELLATAFQTNSSNSNYTQSFLTHKEDTESHPSEIPCTAR
ncbi:uncharacterized protein LOC143376534 [Andrena cerasifolii]|uniref:uncharacterized protein LOC143376534 n=1 Tax=Andrena cerasifolii TaxID=2819439 RepID=UPI0040381F99